MKSVITTASARFSFLLILGAAFLSATVDVPASAGKPPAPGPKRYIYSRSSNPTSCSLLGFSGVPAYVNFPGGGQKLGTFISSLSPVSYCSRMGLVPGVVLLTIDDVVTDSPSKVDTLLRSRNSFSYTYVKMVGGVPTLRSSSSSGHDASVAPSAAGSPPPGFPGGKNVADSDTASLGSLESYMVGLVNDDRSRQKGLPPLSSNSRLADLARTYAGVLLAAGGGLTHYDKAGHSPYDRAKLVGIDCNISENLAAQHRLDKSKLQKDLVAAAEAQMMAEPDNQQNHRGNILSTTSKTIGVGIARNARMLIIVQEFANISP